MTFMDLAKAAAGAGAGGDKPEGPPSGLPNGKVVSLDDLEKRQLTAGGVPADVAQDAKLARGGAPAAGAKGEWAVLAVVRFGGAHLGLMLGCMATGVVHVHLIGFNVWDVVQAPPAAA